LTSEPGESGLLVHIDGASRGNPGDAGFGVFASDAAAGTEARLHGYLGRATNNAAEYQALLHALRWALAQGARRLTIRSDSELVVRQVRGVYRVKHPALIPLYREAMGLIGRFEAVKLEHVPREQNREADRLANLALDTRSSFLG
jgi:ribonuclease HI